MIATIAVTLSAIALALTIAGLIVKISSFATEQRVHNQTIGKDMKTVKTVLQRVPLLEFRVGYIEKHLDLSVPDMPALNGSDNE